MNLFEMGGYLPLELHKGNSYFADIAEEHVFAVNSGRTAIWCAINSLGVKKVYVPYYYCPSVIEVLRSMAVELFFYHVGPDFLPVNLTAAEPDAAVVLVNYFGIMRKRFTECAQRFNKVILDQAHDFYAPPILREGVMNVYSCRKFFGVSDGAYVIGTGLKKPDLKRDFSYLHAYHLLMSIELGTNGAYKENKRNEEELGKAFLAMSPLTERILQGVDYAAVAQRRRENYHYLHENLRDIQQLNCLEGDSVPYVYPLLLDRDIHAALVKERVYVPVLWSQLLEPEWAGTLEQQYASCLIPLPLDQRYGEEQLDEMIQIVRKNADIHGGLGQ